MKRLALCLSVFASLLAASLASADEQKKATPAITIPDTIIVGRAPKPSAAVDVNKVAPKLTLTAMRQPFVDRIEEASMKDPF